MEIPEKQKPPHVRAEAGELIVGMDHRPLSSRPGWTLGNHIRRRLLVASGRRGDEDDPPRVRSLDPTRVQNDAAVRANLLQWKRAVAAAQGIDLFSWLRKMVF